VVGVRAGPARSVDLDGGTRRKGRIGVALEGAASTIRRRLRDGSTHRAIKVAHTPHELQARLMRLGWDIKISTSTGPFFWEAASARRLLERPRQRQ
jgi:hypothetical protein